MHQESKLGIPKFRHRIAKREREGRKAEKGLMFRLSHLKRCVQCVHYHFHSQRAKRETSDIPETSIRLYIHKSDFVAAIS
jgi:hypothetical protein